MVPSGVEALVGVTTSPLGTVLTVGVGGVLTEVVGDVSMRILPVTPADVEAMIDETRLGRLLAGVRGAAPADRAAFVDCVVRLAGLVRDWPTGFELDLNPVTVLGDGVRVLDAAYVAPAPDRRT
jgi:acyl-CoA synthetase (NDP forming)